MKNQILEELKESGHGFIEFYGHYDEEDGNTEELGKTYDAKWERAAKLYLMSCYSFTEEQANSFITWYNGALEGNGMEFDIVEYPFWEEIAWFLEGWNREQIGQIYLGIINIQNIDAQKEPYPKGSQYCWSER